MHTEVSVEAGAGCTCVPPKVAATTLTVALTRAFFSQGPQIGQGFHQSSSCTCHHSLHCLLFNALTSVLGDRVPECPVESSSAAFFPTHPRLELYWVKVCRLESGHCPQHVCRSWPHFAMRWSGSA